MNHPAVIAMALVLVYALGGVGLLMSGAGQRRLSLYLKYGTALLCVGVAASMVSLMAAAVLLAVGGGITVGEGGVQSNYRGKVVATGALLFLGGIALLFLSPNNPYAIVALAAGAGICIA